MKKLCIMVIMLLPIIAQGQIRFGVQGNIGLDNGTFQRHDGAKYVTASSDLFTGISIGGNVEFEKALQINLLITNTGSMVNQSSWNIPNMDIDITQLELDILGKFYIGKRFSTMLGFFVAGNVGVDYIDRETGDVIDVTEEFKEFDFGTSGGFEYALLNGVFFNIGYKLGLFNMVKDDSSLFDKYTQSSVRFGGGYRFGGN